MVVILKHIQHSNYKTDYEHSASYVMGDLLFENGKAARKYVDKKEKEHRRGNGYTKLHQNNWKTRTKTKDSWIVSDRDGETTTITTFNFVKLKRCKMIASKFIVTASLQDR